MFWADQDHGLNNDVDYTNHEECFGMMALLETWRVRKVLGAVRTRYSASGFGYN